MGQYIPKNALVVEIDRIDNSIGNDRFLSEYEKGCNQGKEEVCDTLRNFLDTLEVIDPYEQRVQYDSIKGGIQAQAETYSFNIESELYNQQTTKEGQKLWRKEIEQAFVIGGEVGVELARDPRYKENLEVKEMEEYEQPEHSCFEYKCGKKPYWNVGDTLAYYEFCSDREGEHILGKVANVRFDDEQSDWIYTFEDGSLYNEESLLEDKIYKKK